MTRAILTTLAMVARYAGCSRLSYESVALRVRAQRAPAFGDFWLKSTSPLSQSWVPLQARVPACRRYTGFVLSTYIGGRCPFSAVFK